ncbi:MAG: NADH-quinone oxidoreductase subunit J [Burkholderiaceae bacterium]
MDYQTGFYLFSAVLLFAALEVVTSSNPVHAVLYLMLSFSQASALWLLLKAGFLGLTLVLVYLGAVMVLFLFVVMMLDVRLDRTGGVSGRTSRSLRSSEVWWLLRSLPFFWAGFPKVASPLAAALPADYSSTKELGRLLYSEYLYPVEVAAIILLVAMVAAIALTLRHRKDSRRLTRATRSG